MRGVGFRGQGSGFRLHVSGFMVHSSNFQFNGRDRPLSITLCFAKFRGLMHGGKHSAVIGFK
jgi:hypothetical protein